MNQTALAALKLCVEAFNRRLHNTGLNAWDADAHRAAKDAVKAETGEVFCSGGQGGLWGWYKV